MAEGVVQPDADPSLRTVPVGRIRPATIGPAA